MLKKLGEMPKLVAMLHGCWSGVVVASAALSIHS